MKKITVFLGILLVMILIGVSFFQRRGPQLKTQIVDIVQKIQDAGIDRDKWNVISEETQKLPSIFPVTKVKDSVQEVQKIFTEIETVKSTLLTKSEQNKNEISQESIWKILESVGKINNSLEAIQENVDDIPDSLLDETEKAEKQRVIEKIGMARDMLETVQNFEPIFRSLARNKERILILLQNQNEPRPTGGFIGSFIVLDFTEKSLTWDFQDVYALDRKIGADAQIPAPDFFWDLSKTISLRDANFWPDFAVSAEQIQKFFEAAGEKSPQTVIGLNMNFVQEILKLTGPVTLEKWGVTLDEKNFDLLLQFLVESKVEGRYGVKNPVMEFARKLLAPENLGKISQEKLLAWDWKSFLEQKNVLAFSSEPKLQKLFEKWSIDGRVRLKNDADNFLLFDFVSVGANKSEKFVWTKIWHDSKVLKNGAVQNTIEITRNNTLTRTEIPDLLGENGLFENVRDLLTPELRWKLGEGQNRTIIRIFVPNGAAITASQNPAGKIKETYSDDGNFKIFEVPMFLTPGEKLKAHLEYETRANRGSQNWRPYFLQLVGTPGRGKTTLLETISTELGGKFQAETLNIGRPEPLIDQDYRAVVEFTEEK